MFQPRSAGVKRLGLSRWLLAACVIGGLGACAAPNGGVSGTAPAPSAALASPIAALISAADLPLDSLAIWVQPTRIGAKPRLMHNVDAPMQPGSAMKLITSVVALERLGPLHRGSVEWRGAPVGANGVLEGTSVIRGLGHVELNVDNTTRWLKRLHDAGVKDIRGTVVLDRALYSPARPDVGLAPFDEAPEFRYNVVPDALSLNMNLMGLRMSSDASAVSLSLEPPLSGVALVSQFRLIDGPCADWEKGWILPTSSLTEATTTVVMSGTFPRNCKASAELNVLDRTVFANGLLSSLWRQMGGQWSATVREAGANETLPTGTLLASHSARPLSLVLHEINKISDNPITRMTYLALATKAAPDMPGSTPERAAAVVKAWMTEQKIDARGLVLDNGSGLSRSERISARTLGQTLLVANQSRWGPELQASMPIVGVDGTMRNRLKNTPVQERARIKTGTLRNAYAVAGYVRDADDQPLVVVAMLNDEKISGRAARALLDAVIEWAAASKGAATGFELKF